MEEDCDYKPDAVKLESELILSGEEESPAGPRQEFRCEVGSVSASKLNPVVPENIDLDSVNEHSSGTKIKHEDEFVLDLVPWIKVEKTEDRVPSIDPMLDSQSHVSPHIVSSAFSSESAGFPLEGVNIKQENGTQELLSDCCQQGLLWRIPFISSSTDPNYSQDKITVKCTAGIIDGKISEQKTEIDSVKGDGNLKIAAEMVQDSASFLDLAPSMDCSKPVNGEIFEDSNDRTCSNKFDPHSLRTLERTVVFVERSIMASKVSQSVQTEAKRVVRAKKFACAHCPAKFSVKKSLKQHLGKHSEEQSFVCSSDKLLLKKHLKKNSSTEKKPFACQQCPARFKIESVLNRHIFIHSDTKPFACKQCPAQFKRKDSLVRHFIVHSDKRPLSCEVCSAHFKRPNSLKTHMLTHLDKQPLNSVLNSKAQLIVEKPFPCTQCPARFKLKTKLKEHFVTHSNVRPFACEQCSARFKSKIVLIRHFATHSDVRSFACEQCPAQYKTASHLRRHVKVHSNKLIFFCAHCSAGFRLKRVLKAHIKTHFNE